MRPERYAEPTARRVLGRSRTIAVSLALLVGAGLVVARFGVPWRRERPVDTRSSGTERALLATTATGRQGAYYLPSNHQAGALPLLVILHGTSGKGSLMVWRLRAFADRERFIIVAPDSVSLAGVWGVGQRPDEVTEDYRHVMRCLHEVRALPGVRVDPAYVLIAGYSVGGSVAPYLASHEDAFTAFAVLHGHVVPGGLGARRVRGWLSAGDRDRRRTVEHVRLAAEYLARRAQFRQIETRVFASDHALGDEEINQLVAWWLAGAHGPAASGSPRTPPGVRHPSG
jgi:poly(3-hydroxybutyrate) depolymerase